MGFADEIAFVLHEQWRQTRLKEDGSYEPRWKKIKDADFIAKFEGKDLPKYIRNGENGYEIDIANACYTQLSADWQNENKNAAEVVSNIVESGNQLSRAEIGDIIHNAWLERNSWAKDGELGVPFAELSKEEQDKDMVQFDVALTMKTAKFVNDYMDSLEEVAEFLVEANKNGLNIGYQFNGHNLYSKFDTPDTCFLKVCGKTLEEQHIANELWEKEYNEIKAKMFEEKTIDISSWEKRGEALIYPTKKEKWHNCVESRANDLYEGIDLISALEVMEALEEGKSFEEATQIAESAGHSGSSWSMMMKIVTSFSKNGPAFYRANYKDIAPETEEFLQIIESENKIYESMSKENGPVLGE